MQSQNRRYVFIEFEDLKRIKFKKLERICTHMFVFVNENEKYIPLAIAQSIQRLGKRLKWIPINADEGEDMTHQLAFLMGRMHQKVHKDVEFAILSNDATLDPLVTFINNEGRNCLRVKRQKTHIEQEIKESIEHLNQDMSYVESGIHHEQGVKDVEEKPSELTSGFSSIAQPLDVDVEIEEYPDQSLIEKTARETVKRLIRSGNRPADLPMLKSYIMLHNQELSDDMNIDKILNRLLDTKEIMIENEDVVYNF